MVRRAIEQQGIRRERGWLRQPRGIPIAGDLAPRLVTRAGAAVKTIKARWGQIECFAHFNFRTNEKIEASRKSKVKAATIKKKFLSDLSCLIQFSKYFGVWTNTTNTMPR